MPILEYIKEPIYLVGFLLGITIGLSVHEFAHAWIAMRLGDYTAKYQGRVSLNPSKHIDPWGLLFLLFAGFGWGKPVPINSNALRGRYDELKIAIAGPISNLITAFIFSLIATVYLMITKGNLGYESDAFVIIVKSISEINIVLAVFNLIPVPPLDGSRILKTFLSYENKAKMDRLEKSGFGIIIIFLLATVGALSLVLTTAFSLVFRTFSAIIYVLIDSFVKIFDFIVSLF